MSIVLGGKRVLVIGLGRTGLAVARYLARQGANVVLVDRDPERLAAAARELAGLDGVIFQDEAELERALAGCDLVIPSPGVPRTSPLLVAAAERGITILSELELASRFAMLPLYAITGTNGKSTTTTLLGDMLAAAGRKVFVGGNLGTPFIEAVGGGYDAAVVEVSSFQLEWVSELRPDVAAILNVTPDHLDRYASFDDYVATKERIFFNQEQEDWCLVPRGDPALWPARDRATGRVVSFGLDPVEFGAFPRDGSIVVRIPEFPGVEGGEHTLSLARWKLLGAHNLDNVMAAATMAFLAGVPSGAVQAAVDAFRGLPHRLQLVRERNGVQFIDDSKGTNVGAVERSLSSIHGPVVLLAGGVDKGTGYHSLRGAVRGHVRRLVAYGEAGARIQSELGADTEIVRAASFEEAVAAAVDAAQPGDTVLLSPACASFDMFSSYAERGDRFCELVEGLQ